MGRKSSPGRPAAPADVSNSLGLTPFSLLDYNPQIANRPNRGN
jgi:hypothetical protein